jgi:hypothetical protein
VAFRQKVIKPLIQIATIIDNKAAPVYGAALLFMIKSHFKKHLQQ